MVSELRCNNKELDEVCCDCLENINSTKLNCKLCVITQLKKINNKILSDRYKDEMGIV